MGPPSRTDPPKPPLKRGASGAPPFGRGGLGGIGLQLLLTTPTTVAASTAVFLTLMVMANSAHHLQIVRKLGWILDGCRVRELQVNDPPKLSSRLDAPVDTAIEIGEFIFTELP